MSEVLDQPLQGTALGEGTPLSPRLIVEIWLAVPSAAGRRVLMLRRSERRGGFWQGVSGRVEATDETLRAAAYREIREELGLASGVELQDLGRWYDFVSPFSGTAFRKRSLAALLPPEATPEGITLSDEHVEARLVTFDEARRLVRFEENITELTACEQLLGSPSAPVTPPSGGR